MKRKALSIVVALLLLAALCMGGASFRALASPLLLGDVNGDGKVGSADYYLVKRYVLQSYEMTAEEFYSGDVNGDGRINSLDYFLLKNHALGRGDIHAKYAYRDHLFLNHQNRGNCGELTGKVSFLFVFVSDCESSWDSSSKEAAEARLRQEMDRLNGYAREAGVSLTLYYGDWDVSIQADVEAYRPKEWEGGLMAEMGFASIHHLQTDLQQNWNVDSAPVVFLLNKTGRATAYSTHQAEGAEYLVMYASDLTPFCHELLHLYGARDYYYPEVVVTAAKEHLPESIMGTGDVMDDLTAFTIGWRCMLSDDAKGFLNATAHLTQKDLDDASRSEQYTGYGSRVYANGDLYVGDLVYGVPQGVGEYRFAAGGVYQGEFAGGTFHGVGRMEWAGGAVYEGDFVNGARTGQGIYLWPNGARYEGGFLDGKLHGYGTYTYADGEVKSGYWEYGAYRSN